MFYPAPSLDADPLPSEVSRLLELLVTVGARQGKGRHAPGASPQPPPPKKKEMPCRSLLSLHCGYFGNENQWWRNWIKCSPARLPTATFPRMSFFCEGERMNVPLCIISPTLPQPWRILKHTCTNRFQLTSPIRKVRGEVSHIFCFFEIVTFTRPQGTRQRRRRRFRTDRGPLRGS